MLQFLKKSATRKKSNGNKSGYLAQEENVNNKFAATDDVIAIAKGCESVSDDDALQEAERYCLQQGIEISEVRSRLSRNLLDILSEQSCICYFVQYLETREALSLVKFWLDVESFKGAATTVNDKYGTKNEFPKCYSHRGLNRSVSSDGYDNVSFQSVECDSISIFSENAFDDAIMTTTPTDDGDRSCRTSRSCTPIPSSLGVVSEEKQSESTSLADDRKQMLEVCDLTMRQSLTDDEKTKICETNKLKLDEPSKENKFNSLINSDAVRIYRKYLVSNSPHHIEMPAMILSTISLALCDGSCSERIFDDAQQFLLDTLEKQYLNAFLESSFYCKYTFEVLSSDSLALRDILLSEMALFYFMEYLEQKGKRHVLEFVVTASHFRRSAENAQAQADALVLYEKYISLQASSSLNLSDTIRFVIEEQICSQDVGKIKYCFDLPSRIIERFLERRYFRGFVKSELYKRYLSELLGKIKTTPVGEVSSESLAIIAGRRQVHSDRMQPAVQRRGHRKTFSDVTSDSTSATRHSSFISSHNTLLAMSDSNFSRRRSNPLGNGAANSRDMMHIDSRQLYNPDLLWRRNSTAGLTFGRVDALGRYERDFDIAEPPQDDDRWSKNRLKKAMRKLVNLPEDKAQEELAWQVAEMIVKDITSVTMSRENGNQT
ncbi:A-kinase anchor protein 10, mitochondrial [Toxorhynchites rutilus septentrionalis]|uniref:A-kinase anchor protein 10, mitochondrial n=1 Tax=Toxorhynchites rutilus septentrionalis TaxID=329112 RepID=UPI00247B0443|nr:A-kinase anchor protein 10, mitochondrial [Toxorhynchites rutilus septentrionalis]